MIEAVVQTGSFETPYRRLGSGASVLLLTEGLDPILGEWLFGALARVFRTIVPVQPPAARALAGAAGDGLETWLRGVIDGLGLDRPGVVGGAACDVALRRFATLDPHRLRRLAIVGELEDGDAGADGSGPADPTAPVVLVLGIPGAADAAGRAAALDRLVAFLGGDGERLQADSASRRLS